MKSKNYLFAAALALAIASPMAHANENCETGMQVAGVDGSTISIKNSKRTFTVSEENAVNVQGWGADNYLRFCDGDKLTNISFRTLPTYTVTVNEGAVPVAEAKVEQSVSVTALETPATATGYSISGVLVQEITTVTPIEAPAQAETKTQ